MKSFLFGAMPWVMVAIAAAIFALVVWQKELTSYWEPFKQTLAAMLIGAVVAQFGDGLAKGIREGLDKPK